MLLHQFPHHRPFSVSILSILFNFVFKAIAISFLSAIAKTPHNLDSIIPFFKIITSPDNQGPLRISLAIFCRQSHQILPYFCLISPLMNQHKQTVAASFLSQSKFPLIRVFAYKIFLYQLKINFRKIQELEVDTIHASPEFHSFNFSLYQHFQLRAPPYFPRPAPGAIGSGTGILLAVTIIYQYFEPSGRLLAPRFPLAPHLCLIFQRHSENFSPFSF